MPNLEAFTVFAWMNANAFALSWLGAAAFLAPILWHVHSRHD